MRMRCECAAFRTVWTDLSLLKIVLQQDENSELEFVVSRDNWVVLSKANDQNNHLRCILRHRAQKYDQLLWIASVNEGFSKAGKTRMKYEDAQEDWQGDHESWGVVFWKDRGDFRRQVKTFVRRRKLNGSYRTLQRHRPISWYMGLWRVSFEVQHINYIFYAQEPESCSAQLFDSRNARFCHFFGPEKLIRKRFIAGGPSRW